MIIVTVKDNNGLLYIITKELGMAKNKFVTMKLLLRMFSYSIHRIINNQKLI